jgi:hypothetical protein
MHYLIILPFFFPGIFQIQDIFTAVELLCIPGIYWIYILVHPSHQYFYPLLGDEFYPQKLAITSPTNGGRSVGIVRSRTQTMEFSFVLVGGWIFRRMIHHQRPHSIMYNILSLTNYTQLIAAMTLLCTQFMNPFLLSEEKFIFIFWFGVTPVPSDLYSY